MSASPFLITGLPRSCIATDWNADIEQTEARDGTFLAVLRQGLLEVVSRDPEHDLCHAMVQAGLADGPIQFYRVAIPTLMFRSVRRAAGKRIELGEKFPYKRRPRREAPIEEFKNPGPGVNADGRNDDGRYQTLTRRARGCTSPPAPLCAGVCD